MVDSRGVPQLYGRGKGIYGVRSSSSRERERAKNIYTCKTFVEKGVYCILLNNGG